MSVLAVARCCAALVDILADSELGLLEDAAERLHLLAEPLPQQAESSAAANTIVFERSSSHATRRWLGIFSAAVVFACVLSLSLRQNGSGRRHASRRMGGRMAVTGVRCTWTGLALPPQIDIGIIKKERKAEP
jgi:hypothetical protein